MNIEDIARTAHEVNRSYCAALGDDSQLPWGNAPEWQRTSAVNGVKFHHANPGAKPSASHDSWLAEKEAGGWKYGEIKDADLKTHPCFVPYDELPVEQRAKDYLFASVCRSLLPELEIFSGSVPSTSDERTVNNTMRHKYRVLSDAEKQNMATVKDVGENFLNLLHFAGGTEAGDRLASRELSIAQTKIEEAVMWAVKHITR